MSQNDPSQSMFNGIVENAFDFLTRAIAEFEDHPKYSLIHFAAAVELFLKARLFYEHWTLVISRNTKLEKLDLEALQEGKAKSVGMGEAMALIEKVLQTPWTKPERETLDALASHRNQVIHFFPKHATAEAQQEIYATIAREQLKSWHLLYDLLHVRWQTVFQPWEEQITEIGFALTSQREYLEQAFLFVKGELDSIKENGGDVRSCPYCNYPSFVVKPMFGKFMQAMCRVCFGWNAFVQISCPSCGKDIVCDTNTMRKCNECGKIISRSEYYAYFRANSIPKLDNYGREIEVHCGDCGGIDSVFPEGEGGGFDAYQLWLCIDCLTLYHLDTLRACQSCGSLSAGRFDDYNSMSKGCNGCTGANGSEDEFDIP